MDWPHRLFWKVEVYVTGRSHALRRLVLQSSLAICVLAIPTASLFAEPVDPSQAAVVANAWYELRFRDSQQLKIGEAKPVAAITAGDARRIVVKARTIAYAFDFPAGGCIAIAADDELSPIFYYSLRHRLTVPAVPAAQAIIEGLAERISQLQDSPYRRTGPPDPFWGTLAPLIGPKGTVHTLGPYRLGPTGPLLTSTWNQGEPYNDRCPLYHAERCWVGCTATAMAQIMRYWEHPSVGSDSHSYYWSLGGKTLSADFGSTVYKWERMPDRATTSSAWWVKDAVSTLCYHCGVSVDMQYSPEGSWGRFAGDGLTKYFGYRSARCVDRSAFGQSEWYDLMRSQIDDAQPVLYSVERSEGGHALVLDGYDFPNLVHLNMGWGGSYDGWYTIDHFPTDRNYESRSAIVDIHPDYPTISLSRTSLSPSCQQGSNAPSQSFEVWNSGGGTLAYAVSDNASWLSCSETGGTSLGEHDTIHVTYTTSGLSPATHSAKITIGAFEATNTPQTIRVSLTVEPPPPPEISHSPTAVNNTCEERSSAPTRSFEVWNSGGKTLTYSIGDNVSWLSCDPSGGTSTGEHDRITVNYSTSGLSAGIYSATITLTAQEASNTPHTVPVNLTVIGPHSWTLRHVDMSASGSGDGRSWQNAFRTIQEGIDAASDGDTVIVSPGVYLENVHFHGKNITLRSADPLNPDIVARTIIDGNQANSVVTFSGAEDESCVLSGFTITNGKGDNGGGIRGQERGSPLITHATVENNRVIANSSPSHGGGISWCYGVLRNNVVAGNRADWLGGGLWGCGGTIHNNTIVANSADTGGGFNNCPDSIRNCIIWGNSAPTGDQLYESSEPTYSCIEDCGVGEGNFSDDPQFADGDYRLPENSPCIDAGRNDDWMWEAVDPDGNPRVCYGRTSLTVDVGAYEYYDDSLLPAISLNPISLSNSCQEGANAPGQSFRVRNAGGATLNYSVTDGVPWLNCTPASGSSAGEQDTIEVIYATSDMAPGSYSAAITVSAAGAVNTPVAVPVNLTVNRPAPAIALSTTSLTNTSVEGTNAPSQSFEVWNSGEVTLDYSISDNVSWLTCSPTQGTSSGEHDVVEVSYPTSTLSPGRYSATITISDPLATNTPQGVEVSLTVTEFSPAISLLPTSLSNTCAEGCDACPQAFDVWNSGGATLSYSIGDDVSWLACTPSSGTSAGERDGILVNFATSGLSLGSYSATITVSAPGASNTPQTIPVHLTVEEPAPPLISLSTTSLVNTCEEGSNAPTQRFEIWNAGAGELDYAVSDNVSWLGCSPGSGKSVGEHDSIVVSYTTAGLPADSYAATITINALGTSNSPQAISVNLTVKRCSSTRTRYVDGSVVSSGDGTSWRTAFKTIQCGIDAASDGDTVIVSPGVYVENIHFHGKNITLRSTDPLNPDIVASTIIDGNQANSVIMFSGAEDESCVLSGFTITNGNGEHGGGIIGQERGSSLIARPTIENNRIIGNFTRWHGGGLAWCYGVTRNNIIAGNRADYGGGGLWGCGGSIQNNVISGNSADAGGGLCSCGGTIENNTITGNSAGQSGGGLTNCPDIIRNCIIWGNTAPFGDQLFDSVTPAYSCIQDWSWGGEGNITDDPQFVDLDGTDGTPLTYEDNDYRLALNSPCVDAGTNEQWMWQAVDLDGNPRVFYGTSSKRVDMGAYECGSFAFKIFRASKAVGDRADLSWTSRPGDTYTIWSSSDLARCEWAEEQTISSGGATTSWIDPATTGRVKFYRVEIKQ